MNQEHEGNDRTHGKLIVRFIPTCRRLMFTAAVLRDVSEPWLGGGRAKETIESSDSDAEAMIEICANLLGNLKIACVLLEIKSPALNEYDQERRRATESGDDSVKPHPNDHAQRLLRLVCDSFGETADMIRSFWNSPTEWCSSRALENKDEVLDHVLRSLDYYRWQIVKEFAKLIAIFDDHDDPCSKEPCEAWDKDREAIVAADIRNV
jgi:hypothetical protein